MRDNARLGAAGVARILGRSGRSVRCAASRHRVSLRPPGSRRGCVLGQPFGAILDPAVRAELLDSKRAELIAARMLEPEDELCPFCARRPIRVASTGMCKVCHLKRLASKHREVQEEEEAQRDLFAARSMLHRRRKARAS